MVAKEKQLQDKAMEDGGRQPKGRGVRGGVFTFFLFLARSNPTFISTLYNPTINRR